MPQPFKYSWEGLPSGASSFLRKAALACIVWLLVQSLLLKPSGEPDGWLTRNLGKATAATLNLAYGEERYKVRHFRAPKPDDRSRVELCTQVYRPGMRSDIGIFPACNGLDLMVLAAGFILCFEGGLRRKAFYIAASLVGVFLVNVVRCSLLAVIKSEQPVYFTFAHKYLFNLTGYALVFCIWMMYVRGMTDPAVRDSVKGIEGDVSPAS